MITRFDRAANKACRSNQYVSDGPRPGSQHLVDPFCDFSAHAGDFVTAKRQALMAVVVL